jgi:hypothetical protein
MGRLTAEQYSRARRIIDEEVIGALDQHKGKILDSWYDKLADVLQYAWNKPTVDEMRRFCDRQESNNDE